MSLLDRLRFTLPSLLQMITGDKLCVSTTRFNTFRNKRLSFELNQVNIFLDKL